MLRTLRNRLILSHIIPVLVIVPIMGVALIYLVETQFLLPSLLDSLGDNALLISDVLSHEPQLLTDSQLYQELIPNLETTGRIRLMVLGGDGTLILSTDQGDRNRVNQQIQVAGLAEALKGNLVKNLNFSPTMDAEVIDVFSPIYGTDGVVWGAVRLSYRYSTIIDQLLEMRGAISTILIFGLALGVILALFLGLSISRRIQQVTQAVYDLARGEYDYLSEKQGTLELQRLTDSVNFLMHRLADLETARKQLLANLVHEIGRPLGSLRAGLQALQRGAKKNPALLDELVVGMVQETGRLERLLNQLAHLHDQVLGTLELDRKEIASSAWLGSTLRPFEQEAKQKGLHWHEEIPQDLPHILADPDRLGQVIGNLVNNAIKYTPSSGTVKVSARTMDSWMTISIQDTGPGISPSEMDKIFEPFYRGEQGGRIKKGLGLGLNIAKDLAEAHGGKLQVESAPGMGSTFMLLLPLDLD